MWSDGLLRLLAGARSEKPKIDQSGKPWESPMSGSMCFIYNYIFMFNSGCLSAEMMIMLFIEFLSEQYRNFMIICHNYKPETKTCLLF